MSLFQVDIVGLTTSPSSGGAYALILEEVEGKRRLPIIIGGFEAQAIALELEKIQPPRPMTHDLMRDLCESVRIDVVDVVIDELREGTFFAKIRYVFENKELSLDARPSDAIALAVRLGVPILVSDTVLNEAGISSEDEPPDDLSMVDESTEETASAPMTKLERLKQQLQKAIDQEAYEKAAELRDQINKHQAGR